MVSEPRERARVASVHEPRRWTRSGEADCPDFLGISRHNGKEVLVYGPRLLGCGECFGSALRLQMTRAGEI